MGISDMFRTPDPKEPEDKKPTQEEQELINRFAKWVVRRGLSIPLIMGIESTKPLNWIGSQMMLVGEPAAWAIEPFLKAFFGFNHKDYLTAQRFFEKRESMEYLIIAIEKFDAEHKIKEDEIRAKRKAEKKALRAKGKTKRQKFFRKLFGSEKPEDLDKSVDKPDSNDFFS
ncbi:MAG: hypothetical protein GY839_20820 [candidate division Zixibacteria bacterium]|nr:hypothetical protein [candidate division Zixibacteria bacterium]